MKSKRCAKCPKGLLSLEDTEITAYIEAGMSDGDLLRFEGAGDHELGVEPGDLYLRIVTEKDDRGM